MAFDDLTPSQREPLIALIEALATGDYHDEFTMARRAMERRGDIHLYGKSGDKDRQLEGFTDSDTQVLIEEGYLSRLGLKATLKAKAYQQYNLLKGPSGPSENMTDSVDVHLRRLLKVYHAAGGSQSKGVVLTEVFKNENLSESDSWKEANYMEGEGWIAVLADNGPPFVRLTHQGIKRAEGALATEKGSEDEKKGTALSKTVEAESPMPNATDSRNVFVVHGRNLEARNSLFRFLRSIGLRPLEWSQAIQLTGKASPFIGEILDVAFSNAQAVVVLMTPDDVAQLQEQFRSPHDPPYEVQPTGQARPNVLFEAGMAMGRNPNRTVLVELGSVRPFSDIAGRHTVRLSNDSKARQELAQRLETAGCPVDLSGRDWHTEGDFNVQAPAAVQARPKFDIVCVRAEMVEAWVDERGELFLTPANAPVDRVPSRAAVITLRRNSDEASGAWIEIRARAELTTPGRLPILINEVRWLDGYRYIDYSKFEVFDTKRLGIAIVAEGKVFTYEGHYKETEWHGTFDFFETYQPLTEKVYEVELHLHGKSYGEPVLDEVLYFSLFVGSPPGIHLKATPPPLS